MSDEEAERSEEEMEAEEAEEAETEPKEKPKPKDIPAASDEKEITEAEAAILAAKKKHAEEEEVRMKEYEEQRRIQKQKEEEELAALKEKQERRRKEREEEEAMMAERMKAEEERRRQEEEDRKKRIEADKAKKEAEKAKRAAMMALQGGVPAEGSGPNFVLPSKKSDKMDKLGNIMQAKGEMGLTKDQLEEQKRRYLSEHVKPLSCEGMDAAAIKAKIKELHERICKLEAETYDLEKRRERQDYDLKEMNERQRLINRNKALRKGLDPDAENSRYPPKIPVASKFERQVDRRSYGDRRDLFENPKKKKAPSLFHGSARPPTEWGRRENEELEIIRKNLEPFKYVEQAPIEGARPPMEIVPVGVEDEGGDDEEEEE